VAPVLLDFLERHPQVTAQTLLVDRIVDLMDEGLDVAVRIADLADSSLSASGSMDAARGLRVAGYLRHAHAAGSADLSRHDAIAFSSGARAAGMAIRLRRQDQDGPPVRTIIANTAEVAVAAAVAGRGVTGSSPTRSLRS